VSEYFVAESVKRVCEAQVALFEVRPYHSFVGQRSICPKFVDKYNDIASFLCHRQKKKLDEDDNEKCMARFVASLILELR
jgi:hypothetical protein